LTWPVTRVQSTVWPDSGGQGGDELALGATVALPERVRHVGHVVQPREAGGVLGLGHGAELVGGGNRLGHDLHRLADGLRRQERFALGDVDGADLAGPLVDVLEQVTVDGAQAIEVVRRRDAVAGHRQRPNLDCLVLALTQLLLRRRTDVVAQNPGCPHGPAGRCWGRGSRATARPHRPLPTAEAGPAVRKVVPGAEAPQLLLVDLTAHVGVLVSTRHRAGVAAFHLGAVPDSPGRLGAARRLLRVDVTTAAIGSVMFGCSCLGRCAVACSGCLGGSLRGLWRRWRLVRATVGGSGTVGR